MENRPGANWTRSQRKRDWRWGQIAELILNSSKNCHRLLRASIVTQFRKSRPEVNGVSNKPVQPSMMHICKSRYLTRGEVWFDGVASDTRSVDWIIYHQRSSPVVGSKWRYFYTYAVDLTQSADQLLTRLSPNTAYKIRRAAERDKITCERYDSSDPAVLDQFEEMYNAFAAGKRLRPLNRAEIDSIASAGALDLCAAKDPQGNTLVYHANYCDHGRARSLHSPSLYRKLADS